MIRSEREAAAWLEGLINVEKRPDLPYRRLDLRPIRALLDRLGDPQRELRVVHIAGSKGKGSTALLAESVATAGGARVGTFTSPHLERWTERFRIGGREVEGDRLAAAVETLRPHVETLRDGDPATAPTFFDATTAAALLLFRDARVDAAILEVGLGGRLDSTNAVEPVVTCVTSIELEHTDRLGTTLAAIAGEKAGILKPGVPAVVGALPAEASEVVAARAAEVGAEAVWLGRDFQVTASPAEGGTLALRIDDGPLRVETRLPVRGAHQGANAALAVACLRRSGLFEDAALAEAARKGLAEARLPGRVEVLSRAPWVLVDTAHTAASARALAEVLAQAGAPVQLVLSISGDKDVGAILAALLPHAAGVTTTCVEAARSLPADVLASRVREAAPGLPVRVEPDADRAVREAHRELDTDGRLVVCGSVYLAGLARRAIRAERAGPDAS